jgi:hypothetical protein
MGAAGVTGVNTTLQKWAAVISKAASDLVVGFIEGLADLMKVYTHLEVMFLETDTTHILEQPAKSADQTAFAVRELEQIIIVHALNLLYFSMYQPRARTAWLQLLESVFEEEREILFTSQLVLERNRDISRLIIDGLLGPDFAKALAFYLSSAPNTFATSRSKPVEPRHPIHQISTVAD